MNIYKIISYIILILFMILTTIQTVLQLHSTFDIVLGSTSIGGIIILIGSVMISFLLIIFMNIISLRLKELNIFILPRILFLIKFLFYFILLFVFIFWTIIIFIFFLNFNNILISSLILSNFIVNRLVVSAVVSFIIMIFFTSLSSINIKRIKNDS